MTRKTISVETEGAALHVETIGSGPVLLMIPGGGGTGGRYGRAAEILSDRWTVVFYDRRCCGQSSGDRTAPFTMAQQARDAAAVLRAVGTGPADIFGNSGGANIALALAETAPEQIARLVVHEPPVLPLLDDSAHWIAYSDRIVEVFRTGDPRAAFGLFLSELRGLQGPPPGPPPEPRDMAFFLGSELEHICRYAPEPLRLAATGIPIAAAYGRDSVGAYYARTAEVLAERVACGLTHFDGHHFAFASDPQTFADDLNMAFKNPGGS